MSRLQQAPGMPVPGRIAVRVGDRLLVLAHDDISRVLARNTRCDLHTVGEVLLVRQAFKILRPRLPAGRFLQANRSVLVNRGWIEECRPKSHGDYMVRLRDGAEVVVSRSRRRAFLAVLNRME